MSRSSFAIAVLCFVSTVQRFYKNLLGREGYLMHTLPVTETQLILSKLLTSMVWVLCSGLVGIVCITGDGQHRCAGRGSPRHGELGQLDAAVGDAVWGDWARSSGW